MTELEASRAAAGTPSAEAAASSPRNRSSFPSLLYHRVGSTGHPLPPCLGSEIYACVRFQAGDGGARSTGLWYGLWTISLPGQCKGGVTTIISWKVCLERNCDWSSGRNLALVARCHVLAQI